MRPIPRRLTVRPEMWFCSEHRLHDNFGGFALPRDAGLHLSLGLVQNRSW